MIHPTPCRRRRLVYIRAAAVAAAMLVAALAACVVWAHPADMYRQTHAIDLTAEGVRVTWVISPGYLLSEHVWLLADRNQDCDVSAEEARAWLEQRARRFTVVLDGAEAVTWRVESVEWPDSFDAFRMGLGVIRARMTADWPSAEPGTHRVNLRNEWAQAASLSWFSLRGLDGVSFTVPEQRTSRLALQVVIPGPDGAVAALPEAAEGLKKYWDSGTPSFTAVVAALTRPADSAGEVEPDDVELSPALSRLVQAPTLSFGFCLIALATALMLGALHALAPGHGKSIVAAYLVGSRGTVRDAVFLGGIVTLTHTGSVFLLGLVALVASQYVLPARLAPMLELASGLLIVAVGAGLVYQRRGLWRKSRETDAHDHSHSHDDAHSHDHSHSHDDSHSHDHSHSHGDAEAGGHSHGHVHHHHAPDPQDVTWRTLLLLGVSGGLVPCPDAIAILLIALGVNRLVLGLSLIAAFSVGLAAVLIAIGIAMVQGRRLIERMDAVAKVTPVLSLLSGFVVVALGVGLIVGAVRGPVFSGLRGPEAVQMTAEPGPGLAKGGEAAVPQRADVVYLTLDEGAPSQIAVVRLGDREPRRLTEETLGVMQYALSPDGGRIAYTALAGNGATTIWIINTDGRNRRRLLDSPPLTVCGGVTWSPDGSRLVYEKLDLSGAIVSELPSLWWVDASGSETGPLFRDDALPGQAAGWSPDGEWLSYVCPVTRGIQVHSLTGHEGHFVPRAATDAAIWHPRSAALLAVVRPLGGPPTDGRGRTIPRWSSEAAVWLRRGAVSRGICLPTGAKARDYILRLDIADGRVHRLSEQGEAEDSAAAWSPDGKRVAVVRRAVAGSGEETSRRIWLMRPDGGEARPMADTSDVSPLSLGWSPDGERLLFERHSAAHDGIWVVEVAGGGTKQVAPSGTAATWVP